MNSVNAVTPGAQNFQTFHSLAWKYLTKVHLKSARLFGLRYLDRLQAERRGLESDPAPRPQTPAERLVRAELDRIYKEYYANRSQSGGQAA
jgi:hypothetical protein